MSVLSRAGSLSWTKLVLLWMLAAFVGMLSWLPTYLDSQDIARLRYEFSIGRDDAARSFAANKEQARRSRASLDTAEYFWAQARPGSYQEQRMWPILEEARRKASLDSTLAALDSSSEVLHAQMAAAPRTPSNSSRAIAVFGTFLAVALIVLSGVAKREAESKARAAL